MRLRRTLPMTVAVLSLFAPAALLAQALPNLNLLRVRYNTAKTSAKPEGEFKAQLDQIDKALAEATRVGRASEQRRLMAMGLSLLAGRRVGPALTFSGVARAAHLRGGDRFVATTRGAAGADLRASDCVVAAVDRDGVSIGPVPAPPASGTAPVRRAGPSRVGPGSIRCPATCASRRWRWI